MHVVAPSNGRKYRNNNSSVWSQATTDNFRLGKRYPQELSAGIFTLLCDLIRSPSSCFDVLYQQLSPVKPFKLLINHYNYQLDCIINTTQKQPHSLAEDGDLSLVEQKEITRTTAGPAASTDDYKMVNEKCLTPGIILSTQPSLLDNSLLRSFTGVPCRYTGTWFTP